MTDRILGPTGKRRLRLLLLVPLAALAALILTIGASATVNDAQLGFEAADGNLVPNGSTPNFDWNSFSTVTWAPHPTTVPTRTATKTSGAWTFHGLEDWQATTSDSSFDGGVKQDNDCAGVGTGKADNKADLKRVYIASSTAPANSGTTVQAGDTILTLGWVRIPQNTTSPSAHIAFEFNQDKAGAGGTSSPCGAGSDSLVHRTAGDLLVVYDFEGGTTDNPTISVARWVTGSETCEISNHTPPCWGTYLNVTASGDAEAKVNTGSTATDLLGTPALSSTTGTSVSDTLGLSEFGEAGIDLSSIGVFPRGTPTSCTTFGSAFGVSRTSGNSGTAQMKDLVGPGNVNISNCGSIIIRKVTVPAGDTTTNFGYTTTNIATLPATTVTPFTIVGEGSHPINNVAVGTNKAVTEDDPSSVNYTFTSLNCDASTVPVANRSISGRTVTFALGSGETLDCTYTNTKNKTQSTIATAPWFYPNDKATVGQNDATGSVTFRLFKATAGPVTALANCTNDDGTDTATGLIYRETVSLPVANPNTVNTSNPGTTGTPQSVKIESSQTVYWRVSYSGDGNYLGSSSPSSGNCVENINATLTGDP
jgi:hypothetical protein